MKEQKKETKAEEQQPIVLQQQAAMTVHQIDIPGLITLSSPDIDVFALADLLKAMMEDQDIRPLLLDKKEETKYKKYQSYAG